MAVSFHQKIKQNKNKIKTPQEEYQDIYVKQYWARMKSAPSDSGYNFHTRHSAPIPIEEEVIEEGSVFPTFASYNIDYLLYTIKHFEADQAIARMREDNAPYYPSHWTKKYNSETSKSANTEFNESPEVFATRVSKFSEEEGSFKCHLHIRSGKAPLDQIEKVMLRPYHWGYVRSNGFAFPTRVFTSLDRSI